jgi:linoleate 10R-lipoxygenase
MTIPSENANIMKNLGRYNDYSWGRPEYIPERINLVSYNSAKHMLEDAKSFTVMWNDGLGFVMGKTAEDFCLGGDSAFHHQQKMTMSKLLYRENWHKSVKEFYQAKTMELIRDNSCHIAGIHQVDITRDVGNLAHTHFSANVFSLPLKDKDNPKGIFTDHELYMALAVVFTAVFFDFEPTKSFYVRTVARKLSTMLGKLIELNVKSVTSTSLASNFIDGFRENHNALKDYGIHMIRRLSETNMSIEEMVYSQILPTATAMVPNQSQVFTQIIDFYLSPANKPHLEEIQRLARGPDTPETDDKLLHYAMEGIRLNGTFGSYRRAQVNHTFDDGPDRHITVKPGDKVFCSFVGAARDPSVFPDPETVRADRDIKSYIHYGIGDHTCLGKEASMVALTAMLRVVGRLEGLKRAKGPQGEVKKVKREGGFYGKSILKDFSFPSGSVMVADKMELVYMREDHGSYFPFPMTFKVHYDRIL